MTEIRRGFGGEGLGNERLPWLEPVEDEDDYPEAGSGGGGRIALLIVIGLVALAVLFGTFVLWSRYRAAQADVGTIIHAQPGPYKVKPANPGGLKVDESGVIAEKMGTGTDIDSPLDLSRIPEQPITGPNSEQSAAPSSASASPGTAAPAPAPVAKVPPKPTLPYAPPTAASAPVVKAPSPAPTPIIAPVPAAARPSGGSGTIQLGALASEAKARAVWKTLSNRFGVLAPLNMSITPVKVGANTLYRLRASGGDARRLCAQLRVAGESCNVVD